MSTTTSEDTRERLINAATTLFANRGFEGTSVKELANAAGVNVSLVSYHFGGKEGLYRACLERFGHQRLEAAERVLRPVESAEEFKIRLRMFVEEVLRCHAEQEELCNILHRECDMDVPVAQDIFRDTFLKAFEKAALFFQSAQNRGIIPPAYDPKIVAMLFFGQLIEIGRTDGLNKRFYGNTIKDPKYRERIIDHVMQYCLSGTMQRGTP